MTEVAKAGRASEFPETAARGLWADRLVPVPPLRVAALDGPAAEFLVTAGLPADFPFAHGDYQVCTDDELLAPLSVAGRDYLALMRHEAGWTFAIDTSNQEIWAVDPSPRGGPLFVNTDITRFLAYAGYMNQLVTKCHAAYQRIPEPGEYSHLDRLLGLGDLIGLLEEARHVLTGWDDRAFDGAWWRPEFEKWTVGISGHGGLAIWLE